MDIVYIKKQSAQQDPGFSLSAVGLQTPEGHIRLIPHPFGQESILVETVEEAVRQSHRAGYGAECDGVFYPLPERPRRQAVSTAVISKDGSLGQILLSALPALRTQLKDTSPGVIANAAQALGALRDNQALDPLMLCLVHDDATVRKAAAEAIAKLGHVAQKPIGAALHDTRWLMRHSALNVLLDMMPLHPALIPSLLPQAVSLLSDESWLVRSQAAFVMTEAAKLLENPLP